MLKNPRRHAVAGLVYGIDEPRGYWEVAGWITIALVIVVQLFVLGGIERHTRSDTRHNLGPGCVVSPGGSPRHPPAPTEELP